MNREKIRNIQLYECEPTYQGVPSIPPGDCYSNTQKLENCYSPLFTWSPGANTITVLPEDTGYPIGRQAEYSHVVLEILYENSDNPSFESSRNRVGYFDRVTLRVHMTNEGEPLRANELGVLTLGTESEPIGILIPPGLDRFRISSYCFNNCIRSKFSYHNQLTLVMAFPNTNRAGREVISTVVRNRKEIGYLHYNRYYNSSFHNYQELLPRISISKVNFFNNNSIFFHLN